VDAFQALADPVRRSLLVELAASPARVVDLTAGREISRPAVSRHLRVLLEAGLVRAEERGRERWYSLRPEGLTEVEAFTTTLRTPWTRFAPEALDALDLEVRRTGRDRRRASRPDHRAETEETA
jgi:DNA-binding transcriptional ArsR family regulator